MSNHLSHDQFARCFIGRASSGEMQHLAKCPECGAELERFGNAVSSFRGALRERINERAAMTSFQPPVEPALPTWRWAFGAAAVAVCVLGLLPFFAPVPHQEPSPPQPDVVAADPDALMDAVYRHLSRTLPAPMEPMMSLIPDGGSITKSGGIQ